MEPFGFGGEGIEPVQPVERSPLVPKDKALFQDGKGSKKKPSYNLPEKKKSTEPDKGEHIDDYA